MKINKKIKLTIFTIISIFIIAIVLVLILVKKDIKLDKLIISNLAESLSGTNTEEGFTEPSKTETLYIVNSTSGDNMNITIIIKNNIGIDKIITPNGNTIMANNKEKVAIDYEVVSEHDYIFKIQKNGDEDYTDYMLKANINSKPIINEGEAYAYPMLTDTGIKVGRTVSIDYEVRRRYRKIL